MEIDYKFRLAKASETPAIWSILQQAIKKRKAEESLQWQDGYPNPDVIKKDIEKDAGHVLLNGETIIGYCALLINDEPEYENIIGTWISNGDYVVFHRVAIAEDQLGKGLSQILLKHIEEYTVSKNIKSIKADTNFDNSTMLHIFKKMGYKYCGEVYFRGSARKAFEKLLDKN